MTIQEFRALAQEPITEDDFDLVQYVYNFYPTICDSLIGKKQVAYLYDNFGIRIFKDMGVTAQLAEHQRRIIDSKRLEYEKAIADYDALKRGDMVEQGGLGIDEVLTYAEIKH